MRVIQIQAAEQYFPVVLFIMLCRVVQIFESVDESWSATIKLMKAIEQCFPVVLFIMLYKEVQIFESGGKVKA